MHRFLPLMLITICGNFVYSQNIGIGLTDPPSKLSVLGNMMITEPLAPPFYPPNVSQIKNMTNGSTVYFASNDSVGRLSDPSGPSANYIDNLSATAEVSSGVVCSGIEVTLEDVDLNTGDSLIISNSSFSTLGIYLAVGNGYSASNKKIICNSSGSLYIRFKSNSDGQNGRGFTLLFKKIFSLPAVPINNYAGNTFYFDTKIGALRSGTINDFKTIGQQSVGLGAYAMASGQYSVSLGYYNEASNTGSFAAPYQATASGFASVALGYLAEATGNYSLSLGPQNDATGDISTAMGINNIASGQYSTVIGFNSTASAQNAIAVGDNVSASGQNAMAIGSNITANGSYSTAMGNYVSTSGFNGAFVIGDNSTTTVMQSFVDNGFRARFAGGYRLLTNSAATIGVVLTPNANAWAAISDERLKENLLPVDGESFLRKIALMPLTTWNYKTQDPKTLRHYGPMAQDFFAAFGKDEMGTIGCDTLINQQDLLGVNLIAVQALEKRTTNLQAQLDKAMELIEAYRKKILQLEEKQNKQTAN